MMKNAMQLTLSDELLEAITTAVKQAVKEELPKYQDQFQKKWLSTEEVMDLLDLSRRSIRKYRKEGTLSYSQLSPGGKILYPRKDIEAFLLENMVNKSAEQSDLVAVNPFEGIFNHD
jgi:hypothetical protein